MAVPELKVLAHASPRAREVARAPGDDFFCNRFEVWYPSFDCAVRTRFKTSAGCLHCDQGRFNLERHRAAIRHVRFPFPSCG